MRSPVPSRTAPASPQGCGPCPPGRSTRGGGWYTRGGTYTSGRGKGCRRRTCTWGGEASETTEKTGPAPLSTPPMGHMGNQRKKAPGPIQGLRDIARDKKTWGQRSGGTVLTTEGRCSCRRQSRPRQTSRRSPWKAAADAQCVWPLWQAQGGAVSQLGTDSAPTPSSPSH